MTVGESCRVGPIRERHFSRSPRQDGGQPAARWEIEPDVPSGKYHGWREPRDATLTRVARYTASTTSSRGRASRNFPILLDQSIGNLSTILARLYRTIFAAGSR